MHNQIDAKMDVVEGIILRHKDKVFRTAVAIMGNTADAEDIFQDVFLKLFEKQPVFDSPEHEAAWLIKVTANMSKSRLRLFWRVNKVPLSETIPAQNEEQSNLIEIISVLPPKYKTAIHLFYYEGYSIKEIAELTNQKESTVGNQLARARRMLKNYLEED
ncbi:MAG: sigma-70 family RNA polymerase sigma factor [Oscillospiraceae bacterium]|nr:sigma-70 family RNA polymerase sigma factor [Oscillospiraceae bacterium]